jgi:3-hydroxyisobutyrate dehydrogenase
MTDACVGFVGLGQIGAPMAQHLVDWPGGLIVCDKRTEAMAPFVDAGATRADTPAELATAADVISVMVLDDAQTNDVVTGADGLLQTAHLALSSLFTRRSFPRRPRSWPRRRPPLASTWSMRR